MSIARKLTIAGAIALAVGLALIAWLFLGPARRLPGQVTVVSWGGSFQEAERIAVWQPYSKETGVKVLEDTWNGEFAKIKAQVDTKNVTWDLIVSDYDHAILGCEQGLLVPIPESVRGDANDYYPGMVHKCGVGSDVFAAVTVYDSARLPAAWGGKVPKTIADAFDTKNFPGKRAVRKRVKNFFEQILMSDGVAPDGFYQAIDKGKGFDRFIAKADSIKKDILFFDRNEQAIQLLGDGEVAVSSTFNGRAYNANVKDGKKFVIIWDGQVQSVNTLIVPKGPRQDEALKLAAYMLRADVMGRYSSIFPYGPSRKSGVPHVDKQMVGHLPTAPENMKKALVRNEEWWADHLQEIQEKFNAWLAKL